MRRGSLPRHFLVLAACVAGLPAWAAVQNRITQPVSTESVQQVQDTVSPRLKNAADLGPAAVDTKLQMVLRFSMTADQQTALDQLLADQQNPSSPRYHQWLTPAQFAAQFGLSSADIGKVTAWLASQGFTVTGVAQSGTFVAFAGTVAQAQAAFGTSIHNVSYKGQSYIANVTNASVPGAFASVVSTVNGLHNFRLRPHAGMVRPDFTSSISGNHFIAPGDIYTIYQMNGLLNGGINGQGITIAVTGQVDINPADISAFLSAAGLSTANLPTTVHEGGDPGAANNCSSGTTNCPVPNQDDLAESSIDLEWSSSMAPGATILFVNGPDIFNNALTQAVDQNLAPIVTTSYGACEAVEGSTEMTALNNVFKQASAQGQTIVAAAGDGGATDCDGGSSAANGLAVDFPASSPYVTGIGGTSFLDGSSTGATQYWNSNESSSVNNAGSALSYIPETIWNDTTNTTPIFESGGGGVSGFFSKPAWQVGTPSDGSRDVPDLSMNASAAHDPFVFCVNVAIGTSCTSGFRLASSGGLEVAGGTSIDSQVFGGMLALIEQKVGQRLGNINPMLYAFGNSSTYYSAGATIATNSNLVFNDVTSGNNKMPCTTGTPNCLSGGSIGYSAGSGYDVASGWGSPNLYNMANAWTKVSPLSSGSNGRTTSSTTVTASANTVVAGATVTLTAKVTDPNNSSAVPTGTVTFLINGGVVGNPVNLSSGVASYTYATSCSNLAALTVPKLPQIGAPVQGPQYASTHRLFGAASGASLACLLLITIPRKRRLSGLLVALVGVAVVGSATGCGGGTQVVNPAGSNSSSSGGSSTSKTGQLIVQASYSGNAVYAGSVGSGITAAGVTSSVTPVEVTITQGSCS